MRRSSAKKTHRKNGSSAAASSSLNSKSQQQQQEWSTSYHAESSRYVHKTIIHSQSLFLEGSAHGVEMRYSSDSDEFSSTDDETDDVLHRHRGRTLSQHAIDSGGKIIAGISEQPANRIQDDKASSSTHSGSDRRGSFTAMHERKAFTRSRSPVVRFSSENAKANGQTQPQSAVASSILSRLRNPTPSQTKYLLPSVFHIYGRLPCMRSNRRLTVDIRQGLENILLLCSLGFGAFRVKSFSTGPFSPDMWIAIGIPHRLVISRAQNLLFWSSELGLLVVASLIYCAWTRVSWNKLPKPPSLQSRSFSIRPVSPRLQELREVKRNSNPTASQSTPNNKDFGYVWMTVPKNYRCPRCPRCRNSHN